MYQTIRGNQRMRELITEMLNHYLNENVDPKTVANKYKKMGWNVYVSKAKHHTENDLRLEFEKDDKEFEVIGSGKRWEVFTGPTLSGKGKVFSDLNKAIDSQIG
jgi:alpha-L-fucosidase